MGVFVLSFFYIAVEIIYLICSCNCSIFLQFYCSYGIQYNGKVRVYTLDDLNTTEGQDALINLCDKYYPTLASS